MRILSRERPILTGTAPIPSISHIQIHVHIHFRGIHILIHRAAILLTQTKNDGLQIIYKVKAFILPSPSLPGLSRQGPRLQEEVH